ncbi:MAG: energy transducer TonB [Saprospiraceae bacterium]|nr:energy transducer TonB [Saprospiraceae bacterium]
MFTYLIQSSTCLIIFYIIFHMCLKHETFFRYNRVYLLVSMIFALILPLLGKMIELTADEPVVRWNYFADDIGFAVKDYTRQDIITDYISIGMWSIYLTGVSLILARLFYGIFKIYGYATSGTYEYKNDLRIVTTDKVHLPFSFFNTIYISRHIPLSDHIQTIFEHEKIHIRQWHTLDVLFSEVVHAFFWFNPVCIFYKRALRQSHEYLADAYVSNNSSVSSYASLLLSKSQTGVELALANHFFHSQIKKRITMMYTKNSNKKAIWKYALLLPVLFLFLILFSSAKMHLTNTVEGKGMAADTITPPPAPPSTPSPYKSKFPGNVKAITTENNKVKVELKNGKFEKYDLNKDKDKKAYQARYGDLPAPPPPPPLPTAPMPDRIAPAPHTPPVPPIPPAPPIAPIPSIDKINPPDAPSPPPTPVFKLVDEMPRFPGCEHMSDMNARKECAGQKMLEYVYTNVKYPAEAREKGIEGNCIVQFIIDKNGYINDLKIIRDIGGGCGDEVKRVLTTMNSMSERWIPGKDKGQNVNVLYTLPVKFSLGNQGDINEIKK